MKQRSLKEIEERVGGPLSKVSKMPGLAFSLPAEICPTGAKLVDTVGSVCNNCYALKGRYMFQGVKKGLYKRYQALLDNPTWEFDMIELIDRRSKGSFFRIHPSGDFISLNYLKKWAVIAENLPHIHFWAPTREVGFVAEYLKRYGSFPPNLTIRISNHMVDGHKFNGKYPHTSSVITSPSKAPDHTFTCPATLKGNDKTCDGNNKCRACWNKGVEHINYLIH